MLLIDLRGFCHSLYIFSILIFMFWYVFLYLIDCILSIWMMCFEFRKQCTWNMLNEEQKSMMLIDWILYAWISAAFQQYIYNMARWRKMTRLPDENKETWFQKLSDLWYCKSSSPWLSFHTWTGERATMNRYWKLNVKWNGLTVRFTGEIIFIGNIQMSMNDFS